MLSRLDFTWLMLLSTWMWWKWNSKDFEKKSKNYLILKNQNAYIFDADVLSYNTRSNMSLVIPYICI